MEGIGKKTFYRSGVKSVLFAPDSRLKKMEKRAFKKCALKTICIPSSVEMIGNSAFEDCTSVLFESDSKLRRVPPSAFQGCTKVQTIEYPASEYMVDSDDEGENEDEDENENV